MSTRKYECFLLVGQQFALFLAFLVVGVLQATPQSRNFAFDSSEQSANSAESSIGKLPPAVVIPNLANTGISNRNVNKMNQQTQTDNGGIVIFPKPNFVSKPSLLQPDVNEIKHCQENLIGNSVCETAIHYPTFVIQNLINTKNLSRLFNVDELDNKEKIDTRFQDSNNFKPLCESEEKIYFPKIGVTTQNEWKYIFQGANNSDLLQGVRMELCLKDSGFCNIDNIVNGYAVRCAQKYLVRRLYSIDLKSSETIVTDSFQIPSCCVCEYMPTISSRMGKIATNQTSQKPVPIRHG